MKTILAVAALLAGLAAPALAEEVAAPTPPAQQASAPSTEEIVPAAAPQSQIEGESDMMSLPAEPSVAKGSGGCVHSKSTVYLTN
jgi:opacity protein-like surface antigen